jgi:hypothetical protein
MRRARPCLVSVLCSAALLTSGGASAQDLFELEVFEAATTPPGGYEIEFHANVLSRGSAMPDSAAANHRPAHLSVEVSRGWTNWLETAVFVQAAPFASPGSARLGGGHLRGKVRLGALRNVPLHMALSAEYTFTRAAFDDDVQALEIRPIVDFERGRLRLVANPSLELVARGSEEAWTPVVDISARAAWRISERVALTTDYFSAPATTLHFRSGLVPHHLLFAGFDLDTASPWALGVSAGHCVTGREPWLVKTVVGYRF